MHIIRLHLHDGPMWALPKVSAYLHMDSTDYIATYVLHYVRLGRITFDWSRRVSLGRTCPPSFSPSDVHGNNAIIMGRRGIGGVVLALLGSISEGSIPLTSLVIAGVSAEGLLVEGSYVGLCI